MNISYSPPHNTDVRPIVEQLSREVTKAATFLLIPTEILYFSIYFHLKGCHRLYDCLTVLSLGAFWISPWMAPITCGVFRCLQNFGIAIGTMKLLDIWARRHSLPKYGAGRRPPDWLLSLILLTELRYESFTPNHIRIQKSQENVSEASQLMVHIIPFALLQSLPQNYPTVLGFEVVLSIQIIFTTLQLLVRYKTSPCLFGPLFLAESLTGFWSETWHNVFTSPCASLAYKPLRLGLPKAGVPVAIARAIGVVGSFSLMALFHMYALYPILGRKALIRIGLFFVINGIATVSEAAIWGHKMHWMRTLMAWIFQTGVASWTANALDIPNGLSKIPWRDMCEVPRG